MCLEVARQTNLIAQDGQYHLQCLVALYNRARGAKSSKEPDVLAVNHGTTFAKLVSYIEEACKDNAVTPVFKLADLVNLYMPSNELKQLGIEVEGCINSKKLKDRIMGYFQDMEAHKQG